MKVLPEQESGLWSWNLFHAHSYIPESHSWLDNTESRLFSRDRQEQGPSTLVENPFSSSELNRRRVSASLSVDLPPPTTRGTEPWETLDEVSKEAQGF